LGNVTFQNSLYLSQVFAERLKFNSVILEKFVSEFFLLKSDPVKRALLLQDCAMMYICDSAQKKSVASFQKKSILKKHYRVPF